MGKMVTLKRTENSSALHHRVQMGIGKGLAHFCSTQTKCLLDVNLLAKLKICILYIHILPNFWQDRFSNTQLLISFIAFESV